MPDAWLTAISVGGGGFLGYWLRSAEARRSDVIARFDEIIKEVAAIQTAAREYWCQERAANTENDPKFHGLEAEIKGRLHIIIEFLSRLTGEISDHHSKKIWASCSDFHEICTGGNFADTQRPIDVHRVQKTYRLGALLCADIRDASREKLTSFPINALFMATNRIRKLPGYCQQMLVRARLRFPKQSPPPI